MHVRPCWFVLIKKKDGGADFPSLVQVNQHKDTMWWWSIITNYLIMCKLSFEQKQVGRDLWETSEIYFCTQTKGQFRAHVKGTWSSSTASLGSQARTQQLLLQGIRSACLALQSDKSVANLSGLIVYLGSVCQSACPMLIYTPVSYTLPVRSRKGRRPLSLK